MKNYEGIKGDAVGTRQNENEKCSVFLRFCVFLNRNVHLATLVALVIFVFPDIVFATSQAETLWTLIGYHVQTWVLRFGSAVMFIGGIMFGLGWKNDDAEQKSRGVSTLIAGAIVAAIGALATTNFFTTT